MVSTAATQSANTAATASATTGNDALAKLSGDYTMFLKLLTSQMTNQDPLNPMDTSQYTQQLVQYSQVEQSIQQSSTLKDILARLSSQDMIQASSLIGRTVSYDSAATGLTAQAPANWSWTSAKPPASLSVTITNAAGQNVDVRTLDASAKSFSWDGTLANGTRAPDGLYSLSVAAKDASGEAITSTVSSHGVVQAVSLVDGALRLMVNGQSQDAGALLNIKSDS
jgi:flagellar basal-body rod modification protein FlgD